MKTNWLIHWIMTISARSVCAVGFRLSKFGLRIMKLGEVIYDVEGARLDRKIVQYEKRLQEACHEIPQR